MARRHTLGAVLVAATLGIAAYGAGAWSPPAQHTSSATHRATVQAASPDAAEAVVAERTDRVAEASANERRTSGRDHRALELLAVLGMGAAGVTALRSTMARRRLRRAPTRSRWLAPARAPPLLLPS